MYYSTPLSYLEAEQVSLTFRWRLPEVPPMVWFLTSCLAASRWDSSSAMRGISGGPAIQFNNGVFNGFFLVENFLYNGNPFQLSIQGGNWTIKGWKTNSYADLAASGYLNTGNNGLTNKALLDPSGGPAEVNAVPEPTTIALMIFGVWGLIMARRRESERARLEAIREKEDIQWPCPQPVCEMELSDKRKLNIG